MYLYKTATIFVSCLIILTLLMEFASTAKEPSCFCKTKSYCKALNIGPRQEVYGFATNSANNWKYYDWDKVTTIAVFGEWSNEMLCYAHSKNVRLTIKVDFSVNKLLNVTYRKTLISKVLADAKNKFADGANIDIEQVVEKGSAVEKALTLFSKELTDAFHAEIPGSQVTFDVAWSPDCIDSRCYNYSGIAKVTDFLIVMSYDERSQIYGPCIAGPNSAFKTTFTGIEKYIQLGIKPHKLVLGLPWYGYNYPCKSSLGDICEIKKVPFRGVDCSDAAGRQYCYSSIMSKYLPQSIGGRKFDNISLTPFFNYKDSDDGKIHQIWYDDPQSLTKKYNYGIRGLGLRGLAFWNIDCLSYTGSAKERQQTRAMWNSVFVN